MLIGSERRESLVVFEAGGQCGGRRGERGLLVILILLGKRLRRGIAVLL